MLGRWVRLGKFENGVQLYTFFKPFNFFLHFNIKKRNSLSGGKNWKGWKWLSFNKSQSPLEWKYLPYFISFSGFPNKVYYHQISVWSLNGFAFKRSEYIHKIWLPYTSILNNLRDTGIVIPMVNNFSCPLTYVLKFVKKRKVLGMKLSFWGSISNVQNAKNQKYVCV